jgi:NAD(P)-dependent dehydrogenase (short-subunit alcohol dehydrogenase family)
MDLGVRGKTYALVGGAAGMGYAAAQMLAAEGANIALIGRSNQGAERGRHLAEESGANVHYYIADGATGDTMRQAIDAAAADFGSLDGLAITAGPLHTHSALLELSDDDWENYFQSHLMTTVRACKAAVPHMIEAGGGTIVTISAYSIRAQKPSMVGYTTMKAAIASVTKNIALSFGPQGIRANSIAPGFVATEAAAETIRHAVEKYGLPAEQAINRLMVEDYKMDVALRRVGRTEELGDLIAFLLSARAGYLTGAVINCDGGTQF